MYTDKHGVDTITITTEYRVASSQALFTITLYLLEEVKKEYNNYLSLSCVSTSIP